MHSIACVGGGTLLWLSHLPPTTCTPRSASAPSLLLSRSCLEMLLKRGELRAAAKVNLISSCLSFSCIHSHSSSLTKLWPYGRCDDGMLALAEWHCGDTKKATAFTPNLEKALFGSRDSRLDRNLYNHATSGTPRDGLSSFISLFQLSLTASFSHLNMFLLFMYVAMLVCCCVGLEHTLRKEYC